MNATTADFQREMEEVSNQDLDTFFKQWLYKSGALELAGTWSYDKKKKQIKITLNQTQDDGSLFEMPIEVGVTTTDKTQIHTIQINKKANVFTLDVVSEPTDVVLDPNLWVLMNAEFGKGK
jgi:aminopeptidase N